MYTICTLYVANCSSNCVRTKVFTKFRVTLIFDLLIQNVKVSSSHHPAFIYEVWKLHTETYSSYRVRTKELTKFSWDLDLWTPQCLGICPSPSCIYVWNIKAVRWKLLKLWCQNQIVDKVPLWLWPVTFWPQNKSVSSSRHPASMYEICTLYVKNYPSYRVRTKVLTDRQTDRRSDGQTDKPDSYRAHAQWWGPNNLMKCASKLKI